MHALDLHQLVVFDIADKLIKHWVVGGAGLIEQVLDHFYSAFMMGDHQLQKKPIKARRVRVGQLGHLLGGRHPGHGAMRLCVSTRVNSAVILPMSVCHIH